MLGHFEFQVLSAVEVGRGDAYGVSIKSYIAEEYSKSASYGALYTTLSRLEEKGFVSSQMGSPTSVRGGRRKKFYKLTPLGSKSLSNSRSVMRSMVNVSGASHA